MKESKSSLESQISDLDEKAEIQIWDNRQGIEITHSILDLLRLNSVRLTEYEGED